ncbi:MAG: carboxypeptidase-like regulatory domain-containing protein [Altibacter sp.]|uniref:carboxypeptidase-like regulatory domain-containing protein n=1 Tax=Altibacter sp. TaxID=2024823 RepID=UPI001D9112CE|nr:carboxypeptidase-like regulatory domain-containing protein [Altibacter sp.]MBZ0328096.1 carboxypeptidase-like regulatory domain-containing protein [Altibacter sp.]
MVKVTAALLLLLLPVIALSQEIERNKIQGIITAPVGEDVENVSVYNISSQKGTITNIAGAFELEVVENDRIQVTALQFQSFTIIVDSGVIETGRMAIYLNPSVNQLDEVIVRPYDLSGNIIADVGRIKTANMNPQWDLSYETLEFGYEFSDDQYTSIVGNKAEEAFYNGQKQASLNFIGLAGLFFPKKPKKEVEKITDRAALIRAMRQRFSNAYITETFAIPEERVNDFIYFLEENGVDAHLLKLENELLLLDFLTAQSIIYKADLETK